MGQKTQLTISAWTVLKVAAIIIGIYLLFLIRDILALFFMVLVLAATFSPVIDKWSKKIGRVFSVVLLLLIFLTVAALGIYMKVIIITVICVSILRPI